MPALQRPNEVWMTACENGDLRMHCIKIRNDRKASLVIVVPALDSDTLYNFFPMSKRRINKLHKGALPYRHTGKTDE